jgi:hypothetical protein
LKELCGAHGLTQTENARWMLIQSQPVEPISNIFTFEQSVRRNLTGTLTVGAGIREENTEAVFQ